MRNVIQNRFCGPNSTYVQINNVEVWFSYQTPIAFRVDNGNTVIRENEWNNTTGKHLNAISPDKAKRISGEDFENQISRLIWT